MLTRIVRPLVVVLALTPCARAAPSVTVSPATGTAYQPVTFDLDTEAVFSETGVPNPFMDRRLIVNLTSPSGATFAQPGFFAGDGSGATVTSHTGTVFRAVFSPTEPGAWTYAVSFREGSEVAIDLDPSAGTAGPGDGLAGGFTVDPPDVNAPGALAKGRLAYAGDHYLRFADGSHFVKGGVDSPENWLGYTGFDNTFDGGAGPSTPDGLHAFPTHAADWNPGDPDWDRTDPPGTNNGRAIVGALNYIASTGANSIYFLPMNIGGDGKDSWPYVATIDPDGDPANDNLRFDNSRLAQWDLFFAHAQRKGLLLHFVLAEAEAPNKRELDGYNTMGNPINPDLGPERKLFYREMVARFGYHNAIQFNLCEEYNLGLNLGVPRVLDYAQYLSAIDPHGVPVTVHQSGNGSDAVNGPWTPFYNQPDFDLTSIQQARRTDGWGNIVEDYRAESTASGRHIAIMIDEPGSPTRDFNNDFDEFRKRIIWPVLASGGGFETFINNRDQALEDFREFDQIWTESGHAVRFFEPLPLPDMTPGDALVSGASTTFAGVDVFAQPGRVYAIYWPDASPAGTLDLAAHPGQFTLRWYNPRSGAFEGSASTLVGGAPAPLPVPPADPGEDWAALVTLDCPGDINTTGTTSGIPDGSTNLSDLQFFLTAWQNDLGATPGSIADVNTTGTTNGLPDGDVNLSDLQFYFTAWQSGLAVCP